MTVDRYVFQSPYSSQIQIGKPDTSSVKENDSSQEVKPKTEETLQNSNDQKLEKIISTEKSNFSLDTYA